MTTRALLFRNRDFGLFWLGFLLVNLAIQIEVVTIGWQIYGLGRATMSIEQSAFLVGMVGLSEFLPMFFLSLWGGALADQVSRKAIVAISLLVEGLCVLALVGVALEPQPDYRHIFAVAAVFGAARAFLSPATSALAPMLVPVADMPSAISLKTMAWQGSVVVGPWVGGLLCAQSTALSYGVAASLYVLAFVLILFLRTDTRPAERPQGRVWAQIREGLAYTWSNKIIFGAISLDLFAVLLGGATALLPAFASDILQVGPEGFGVLRSGPAIGALAMTIVLARWPLKRRAGVRMFWAVAAFGAATVVFGLSQNMWLSVAALAVLGAADMISVYVRQTLVQIVTPDHMRGRVSSVSGLFVSGSNELGEFESGVVARVLGPVGAAVFGGIGTLCVTGLWAWMFPALRRADRLDAAPEDAEPPFRAHPASAPAGPL